MAAFDRGAVSALLDRLVAEGRAAAASGRPADYIPALAAADPLAVGAALCLGSGEILESGESRRRFTIQSVSKVLALAYVLETRGEEAVFSRVGKEPTGDPFNSIIRLETSDTRKPYNPLINAGAIVVSGLEPGSSGAERCAGLAAFVREAIGGRTPAIDEEVYRSESGTASRNRAIAWFLDNLGLLGGGVDEVLDAYFRQCAILLDATELARVGALFALDGLVPGSGCRLVSVRHARIVKGLMITCGLYDGSGEFCSAAGLPAKSGVGGGILASALGRMGIGAYGPALDERGNSLAGIRILTRLSEELGLFEF
jgi:glutaminase